MPASFAQFGARFDYPENWSVEFVKALGDQQVVVSSPNTAFWQLSKHPHRKPLDDLFDEALAALRAEYRAIEVEPADETLEGRQIRGFTANFFFLDLTNTCWLQGFTTSTANWLVLCQAEDREFDGVQDIFRAILTSLLRNFAGSEHHG